MVTETQHTASSKERSEEPTTAPILFRGRRVEDELRLRELELQTNFQVQTLTDSLNLLKSDFISWRDSLNMKLESVTKEVDGLKTRLTIAIALIAGQFLGADALFMKMFGA